MRVNSLGTLGKLADSVVVELEHPSGKVDELILYWDSTFADSVLSVKAHFSSEVVAVGVSGCERVFLTQVHISDSDADEIVGKDLGEGDGGVSFGVQDSSEITEVSDEDNKCLSSEVSLTNQTDVLSVSVSVHGAIKGVDLGVSVSVQVAGACVE